VCSSDLYVFVREAYLQRREYMINDGLPSGSEDFEDFEDF
jgi:ABC-type transporter lipoprotein component MlaA